MSALDLFERQEWHDRAACRDENDPAAWFPHSTEYETAAYAKAICATCPVRGECLDAGITEEFGIWGGLSERARRRLRKQRKITARTYLTDPAPAPESEAS